MNSLPWVLDVVLAALVMVAGVYDFRFRRIPNWLVLCGLIAGFALNAFLYEWAGLKGALLGMGLATLVYLPLYMVRGMGAGDVKLMAAVGAIVGPRDWIGIFILTAILGGLTAIVLILAKGRVGKTIANLAIIFRQAAALRVPYAATAELDVSQPQAVTLPHGVMIAFASVAFILASFVWAPR